MAIRTFQNDKKTLLRFVAFSSFPIKGFFRYKNVLQIMSLPDEAPKPQYLMGALHPLVIEYVYDSIDGEELVKIGVR